MRYLILAGIATLLSCSAAKKTTKADGTATTASLSYSSWELQSIPGFELESTPKKVTLHFIDSSQRIGGNAGCNGFGGNYTLNGTGLKLEKILSTKMACQPGMQTENRYMQVLMGTDNYEIKDGMLLLKKGSEVLATLKRMQKMEK